MVNTNSTTRWLTSVAALGLSCILDACQCVSSGGLKTNVTPSRPCTPCRQPLNLQSGILSPLSSSRYSRPVVLLLFFWEDLKVLHQWKSVVTGSQRSIALN